MSFQHLLRYGYAPGNYMNTCRTCNETHIFLDKRARCCLDCATAKYAADLASPPPPPPTLRACPFCGHQPEEDNLYDSIHRVNREGTLWTAGCVDNEGGCNASVLAGSREEAIAKWNARPAAQSLSSALPTDRIMVLCPTCGNKRCPRAENPLFKCTNSNAVGQVGELDA